MDAMTAEVITVDPDTSMRAVAALLSERGISGVPFIRSRPSPRPASRGVTSEFVVIGLFKRFKFVDSLTNSVDPRPNEFAS